MRTIYCPAGRAREYSELALNLYDACDVGCAYCFVNTMPGHFKGQNHCGAKPKPRITLEELDKAAAKMEKAGDKSEILLCFTCDPYPNNPVEDITTDVLKILEAHKLKVQILTKSTKVERDFDMIHYNGWKLGFTFTHTYTRDAELWEPGAHYYIDRARCLVRAHKYGIQTFVSLEPVINTNQALEIIYDLDPYVDMWKIGKLNHRPEMAKYIDYSSFLREARMLLAGKNFYIKKDLWGYL